MSRLDQLARNKLVTDVLQLRQDIDQLKERQATSMASGVLGYLNQTANTWDAITTVGSNTDSSTRTTTVTIAFVGDGSQAVTFADLDYAIYANVVDSAHQLTIPDVLWTDGTRTASFQPESPTISRNNYTLIILVTTLKQVTLFIKAYVPASQRGTVTVTVT